MAGTLPLSALFTSLAEGETGADKEKARKIRYYASRIKDLVDAQKPMTPVPKYALRDSTGFDGKVGFFEEVLGFAFVDSQTDWDAILKFREGFEKTEFLKSESNRKGTGVPTALPSLVDLKGSPKQPALLKRMKDSFDRYIPRLKEIVKEVDKARFISIPHDENAKKAFTGLYYYLQEYGDNSTGSEHFRKAKESWNGLSVRADKLSKGMREMEKRVQDSLKLTHALENDKQQLISIENVLNSYEKRISPYTKFLFASLIRGTTPILEKKLIELEKDYTKFRDDIEDEVNRFQAGFEELDQFDEDTYKFLNKKKEELVAEFQSRLKVVCQKVGSGGKVSLENVPDLDNFNAELGELADELGTLSDINESLQQAKNIANVINKKLQAWEDK